METTCSGLSHHLYVSIAISSPLVKQHIQLSLQIGSERSIRQILISRKDNREVFCVLRSEAMKSVQDEAIASMDDLVDVINTAKKAFLENLRQILVLQINVKDCDVLLVGKPETNNFLVN